MSTSDAGFGMQTGGTLHGFNAAARAYAATASRRSVREQEAEVFRRVNATLRRGREAGGMARVRALADVFRLWNATLDLVGDPDNALPPDLRAAIISVGMAVRREVQSDDPDFDFLMTVNEDIAAGLSVAT